MLRVICVFCAFCCLSFADEEKEFPLLMPNVTPWKPELYLCTPVKVLPDKNFYIVGFSPNATMDTAHHILLYGCLTPGRDDVVWNCGEMVSDQNTKTYSPCGEGSQVIYAWARDAPRLTLPKDVGFRVGKDSDIKYIVLQVHYAVIDKFKDGSTDNSGIILHYTETPKKKLAGVLLLGTGGIIPPNSVTQMETDCRIKEKKTIYPIAYRTHTHSLGKVVAGYHVTTDENGVDHWIQLGKRDPLTPQMFYPVKSTAPIKFGDRVAARCTMESHRNTPTRIGATNKDEMCNYYILYHMAEGTPLDMKYCFTPGPPYYSWRKSEPLFNHIPVLEASTL